MWKFDEMRYPDIKTYERLYQRFLLGDRTEQMFRIAGDVKDKVFLDICCGGGRLTKKAISEGSRKNIMIDSEANMIPKDFDTTKVSQVFVMTVEESFRELRKNKDKIDIAMCQQGVNYWLTESKAWKLSLAMSDGGVFVFNTFNNKPSEIPKVREYTLNRPYSLEEDHFVEISWLVKNDWFDVHHVQICNGLPPHITQFKWCSDEYIRDCLDKFFKVDLITDNKTSIYKCTKK